jgi:hypothetical protein
MGCNLNIFCVVYMILMWLTILTCNQHVNKITFGVDLVMQNHMFNVVMNFYWLSKNIEHLKHVAIIYMEI